MSERTNHISALFLALIVVLCLSWMWQLNNPQTQVQYSDVRRLFLQEQVESFVVEENTLKLNLAKGKEYNGNSVVYYELYDFDFFYNDLHEVIEDQFSRDIIKNYNYHQDHSTNWLELLLPGLLTVILIAVVCYFMFGRNQGMSGGADRMSRFSSARTRTLSDADRHVTFDDVAGAQEEKEELAEIVDFLRDPDKYVQLGARIPKGVLLIGPPGTGKTLLAKAVAGEAQVGFLSISGSDFVELYVGVGASRVRDLFEQAKRTSPAIVFIDEIDAVGRQRGTGLGGGHDEREQTLNQLLVEMDGFSANEGVVVLAATNRADVLDPALLRPGRFDRQIYVGLPDIRGREEILRVHAKGKPLADDVDLHKLAQGTAGFTGADLENLVNEGALLAARQNRPFISMDDLREAEIKVIAGPEKRSRVIPQHERELTAWHEAGHAVVSHSLPGQDPVTQISIVPRGQAGGMTISLPEEDRSYLSKRYMEDKIVSLLGGRVAERLCLKDISTGASNDIQNATEIARKMVAAYGMSDRLGTVAFDSGHDEVFLGRSMGQGRAYSEAVAAQIDEEIKQVLAEAYQRCEDILNDHRKQLDKVARYLLEHETMERDAFLAVMDEKPLLEGEVAGQNALPGKTEESAEPSMEESSEPSEESSVEESAEPSEETSMEESAGSPEEKAVENPVEQTDETSGEKSAEPSVENPGEESVENSGEPSTDKNSTHDAAFRPHKKRRKSHGKRNGKKRDTEHDIPSETAVPSENPAGETAVPTETLTGKTAIAPETFTGETVIAPENPDVSGTVS